MASEITCILRSLGDTFAAAWRGEHLPVATTLARKMRFMQKLDDEVDAALADLDIVCEFEQQDGARNHAGRYQIHSWGPIDRAWVGQHVEQIKRVLGYP